MLTEEQIITIKKAAIATDPGKPWGDSIAFARAIESAVSASKAAEYADVPPAIDDLAANLAMAVKQLCHALKRHEPDSDTAARAMQYLQKHNLIGSPLR